MKTKKQRRDNLIAMELNRRALQDVFQLTYFTTITSWILSFIQ